jgi:hypothetical protein
MDEMYQKKIIHNLKNAGNRHLAQGCAKQLDERQERMGL